MSSSDRDEIRKVFEEVYAENVRTKNLQGYGEMYTENALWMAPNVADRCGREDIIEGFAATIANQDIDPIFTADEIEVMGDFGYVIGISVATIYPNDGSPAKQVKFRALWLMKKEFGNWKIDRQIWNNKPL
ncbi:MAG: SgcJ/EcaC family oxidoreductase [Xenococcaceae cyanobacterium MO_207.B15]|nr:SgcJ/EcaC family oxidoreductase [Xenococcaceae cyanobacterium MO_207.B15]